MRDLRHLFETSGVRVPRLDDEMLTFERECRRVANCFYDNGPYDPTTTSRAHLSSNARKHKDDDDYVQVFVSAVETPHRFYVQNEYSHTLLEKSVNTEILSLVRRLEALEATQNNKNGATFAHASAGENHHQKSASADENALLGMWQRARTIRRSFSQRMFEHMSATTPFYCLARLTRDNEFFRAQIVEFVSETTVRVFFVDYGDYDTITLESVWPISERLLRILPFQAIECRLDNLRPAATATATSDSSPSRRQQLVEWPNEAGDWLWSLTHNEHNMHRELYARPIQPNETTNAHSNSHEDQVDDDCCMYSNIWQVSGTEVPKKRTLYVFRWEE